ncbi:MAG: DedA [Parcubacteria group bacterium GW2011_GWC2_42_6]|nr:MAG: DedA [Parcubacteria group bacterium GW2011_GWA2_42_11]KKS66438.1 MAG: DedA [Parcubacteria group bacterium GW2011_GWC2_42_6]
MKTCAAILSYLCLSVGSQLLLYFLIVLAMVFEGEIFLLVAGSLVHLGVLKLVPLVIAAVLGTWLSDIFWYWLGWRWGETMANKYGRWFFLTPERFLKVKKLIAAKGVWLILATKFSYGLSHIFLLAAGATHFNFKKFIKYQIVISFGWALFFIFLGKIFAFSLMNIEKDLKVLGLGLLALVATFLFFEHFIQKIFTKRYLNGNGQKKDNLD